MPCIWLHQTWQIYPHQSSIDALHTITPNMADLLADVPPQSSIDALHIITPNIADLLADLPQSIEHRCLAYHYIKHGRSVGRSTPPIEHRCLAYHYSKHGRSTGRCSPSIKHRCLAYHYTKHGRSTPSQSSTDALHTITPNMADQLADLPPSIKYRCLAYHYTKHGRSPPQSIKHVDVVSIWEIQNVLLIQEICRYSLSLMQLPVCMQLEHSFMIVIIFRCCNFATNSLHTVQMLIWYHHHFLVSSVCNWPSSGVVVLYNIPSVGVKGTSSVLWSSANFCSISQNMHYKAPVAAQHWKTNKVVCTWKDDWPPWRTSTYERPFTQEGNYIVSILKLIYANQVADLQRWGVLWKRPFTCKGNYLISSDCRLLHELILCKLSSAVDILAFECLKGSGNNFPC